MVRACLVSLLPAALAVRDEPTPAERTDAQVKAFSDKSATAKAASEAATSEVLAFFDSEVFRSAMEDCCPLAAGLSAQELLDAFHAEVQVAELAHAFPAVSSGGHFTDVTLEMFQEKDWFLNEWQVGYLDGGNASKSIQNAAATGYFGLPSSPDAGYSWSEASDRLIYVAQNFVQQDFGSSPNFGSASAIFDTEYVRDMVLIAPSDTGLLHMSGCDGDSGLGGPKGLVPEVGPDGTAWPGHSVNCSAWHGVVGSLDHNNHLILANFDTHADESKAGSTRVDQAKAFFQRSAFGGSYVDLPELSSNEYWESNIVGNPSLKAVKFLIGSFPDLFGTDAGRSLQETAEGFSWPLAWAFGTGGSSSSHHQQSVAGNKRLLDPSAIHSNASLATDAASAFEKVWQQAVSDRAAGVSNSTVASWWDSLVVSQVRLAPLTARSCSDTSRCIGTDTATGDCVCTSSVVVV